MSRVTTGVDLARRLDELTTEFTARSLIKSHGRSQAVIVWHPPYGGMESLTWPGGWVIPPGPQSWDIVYKRPNGDVIHHGSTIGHTRAETVAWLIRHRRQWGM